MLFCYRVCCRIRYFRRCRCTGIIGKLTFRVPNNNNPSSRSCVAVSRPSPLLLPHRREIAHQLAHAPPPLPYLQHVIVVPEPHRVEHSLVAARVEGEIRSGKAREPRGERGCGAFDARLRDACVADGEAPQKAGAAAALNLNLNAVVRLRPQIRVHVRQLQRKLGGRGRPVSGRRGGDAAASASLRRGRGRGRGRGERGRGARTHQPEGRSDSDTMLAGERVGEGVLVDVRERELRRAEVREPCERIEPRERHARATATTIGAGVGVGGGAEQGGVEVRERVHHGGERRFVQGGEAGPEQAEFPQGSAREEGREGGLGEGGVWAM